jgi:hypothetical protein
LLRALAGLLGRAISSIRRPILRKCMPASD